MQSPLQKGVSQNAHPLPPLKQGGSPKHTPLTTLEKGGFPKTHTPYHPCKRGVSQNTHPLPPQQPSPSRTFFSVASSTLCRQPLPKKPNSLALRYCDTQPSTTVTTVINRAVVPAETTKTCTPFSKGSPLFKGRISW